MPVLKVITESSENKRNKVEVEIDFAIPEYPSIFISEWIGEEKMGRNIHLVPGQSFMKALFEMVKIVQTDLCWLERRYD